MEKLYTILVVLLCTTLFTENSFGKNVTEHHLNLNKLGVNLDQGKGKPEKSQTPKNQPAKTQEQGKSSNTKNDQQATKKENKQEAPTKNKRDNDRSNDPQGKKPQKGDAQKGQTQKGDRKNGFKGNRAENKSDKRSPSNFKNNKSKSKENNFKHPYKYGSPGVWYSYGNNQGFYMGRNYGQWRAAQARNKHNKFHPRYEYEAVGAFTILVDRNIYLVRQTDHKIIFLRSRLLERKNEGLITVVAYEDNLRRIEVLEKRRSNIELSLNMYV